MIDTNISVGVLMLLVINESLWVLLMIKHFQLIRVIFSQGLSLVDELPLLLVNDILATLVPLVLRLLDDLVNRET